MKINFLIFLMLAILFINGCATTRNMELTAVALPDQKTDPYGAVVSGKKHMVSMSHYKEIDYMRNNAIFNIIIENGEDEPLTIGNENISMIFEEHDKKHTVKKLDVQSEKEFMNDLEYEYKKRLIGYLVEAHHYKDFVKAYSVSGDTVKLDEFYFVFLGGRDHDNQPTKLNMKIAAINKAIKTLRETLPDLILNQKTIMPRESIGAIISCRTDDIPRGIEGDFKISVSIDGEEHIFTFARK